MMDPMPSYPSGQPSNNAGFAERALADLNHAIELDPGNAWAIASRSLVYMAMERYDEATVDLNHALRLGLTDLDNLVLKWVA